MPLATTGTPAADEGGLLLGWDLGLVSPVRRRRTVFLPGKARCSVCGCSITNRQWNLFQTCDFLECQAEHRRQMRVLRKEIDRKQRCQQKKFDRRVHLLRKQAAEVSGVDGPERFVCVVIPAFRCPVTPLPEERRSALGGYLRGLIVEANGKRIGLPDNSPYESESTAIPSCDSRPLSLTAQACAMCQGNCCVQGGNQAYLDVEAILRYLKKHPGLEETDIIDFFLSHVEVYTYKDSCIYHGVNGCSLPRDVRSTTCNEFECTGMKGLMERIEGQVPHRTFLVAAEKNRVVRYGFIHG